MRYLCLLLVGAVACGGGGAAEPGSTPKPVRNVRLLTPDDPSLRPLTIAAAGFLKTLPSNGTIGFGGVTLENKDVPELTAEIVRRYGFVQPVSKNRIEMDCAAVRNGTSMVPTNCKLKDFDVLYAFQYARVYRDSGYVGASVFGIETGKPETHYTCIALVVDSLGWKPVRTQRVFRSKECGA
jgi:hypothetical protein